MPGIAVEARVGSPEGNALSGLHDPELSHLTELAKKLSLGGLHWLGQHQSKPPEVSTQPQPEKAILAESLAGEEAIRARTEQWLGSFATGREVKTGPEVAESEPKVSLIEQLDLAEKGDETALSSLAINARTNLIEMCFKTGNVTKVKSWLDEQGEIVQYGQSMRSIYANTLTEREKRHAKLEKITEIEVLNGERIAALAKEGKLKDHYFVVFSLIPNNAPIEAVADDGYFLDTMTYAIQATTSESGSDELVTESAFMRGVQEGVDTVQGKFARRHDFHTVANVRHKLGVEAPMPTTAQEVLHQALLVPKSRMQDGIVDIVQLCDQELGQDRFFGTKQEPQNYKAFVDYCETRMARMDEAATKVVNALIELRKSGKLTTPLEAFRAMHDICEKQAVDRAIEDKDIDPAAFGRGAQDIRDARNGDASARNRAYATAETSSCGTRSKKKGGDYQSHGMLSRVSGLEMLMMGELIITNCPYCETKDTTAILYKDEDGGMIKCQTCETVKDFCEDEPIMNKGKVEKIRRQNRDKAKAKYN